jgi:hypothetical protein
MIKQVNESREALVRMSQSQNINIVAHSNLAEVMKNAKIEIASLKSTMEENEISLKAHLDNVSVDKGLLEKFNLKDGLNMDNVNMEIIEDQLK